MNDFERVEKCLRLIAEIREIEDDGFEELDGGPQGIASAWPTGMPFGTNDRLAALLQRTDVNEAIDRLEALGVELELLAG